MSGHLEDQAFFLPTRLLRWGLAEVCCFLGNLTPRWLAVQLWSWALWLNRHQEVAAMNRAVALFARTAQGAGHRTRGDRAWAAFETVLEQLHNPWNTSASDLHLSRTPGRLARRLTARVLWGPAALPTQAPHDHQLQAILTQLARGHFARALTAGRWERATRALDTLTSLIGPHHAEVLWNAGELAWRQGERGAALERIRSAAEGGDFLSPLDALCWAERALGEECLELAESCLAWGRRLLPEEPGVWRLLGNLACRRGQAKDARVAWERALALDPQDLDSVLALVGAWDLPTVVELEVEGPTHLALGASVRFLCRLPEGLEGWRLRVLPPVGRGVMPQVVEVPFDSTGQAQVEICAHRPHRVHGAPWPLLFLAVGPQGHGVARHTLGVVDDRPGRLLLTITEDHEIHEERGLLGPAMLERLLVDKSRFASQRGVPWTHMVETGSTLAMHDEAAAAGGSRWRRLRTAVRRHLAEEVASGNDLQPHLHTFNDPAYHHFPYRLSQGDEEPGWRPHLRFLLTAADRRGDWASVCPPPARAGQGQGPDRLASVARAVAQLEAVGRLGDPDFRPILWRSGLLEYGDSAAACAWSAVALRYAGLLADSDLPKPASARADTVSAAFPAGWERPFAPCPGGPLLQLPIAANLEGDYLMGPGSLHRRALASLAAVRRQDGQVGPGVHLFTLLTHDKFINARRGREEFRCDPAYGDWPVIDRHLASWQRAGAQVVTARQGVEAVLDDLTWRPLPRLVGETFVLGSHHEVRYRVQLLGGEIPVSADFPHQLLISIPCSLREDLESVEVHGREGDGEDDGEDDGSSNRLAIPGTSPEPEMEPEMAAEKTAFWLPWQGGELPQVSLRLRRSIGPRLLRLDPVDEGLWSLELAADEPFLEARLLLPWELGLPQGKFLEWRVLRVGSTGETPSMTTGKAPGCHRQAAGVVLDHVAFAVDDQGRTSNLRMELSAVVSHHGAGASTREALEVVG